MTPEEFKAFYAMGIERGEKRKAAGGRHRWNYDPTPEQERRSWGFGLVAEVRVAEYLHRAWLSHGDEPDDPDRGDVEGGVSVRWTDYRDGCLLVHEDERPHLSAALVVGTELPFTLAGWWPVPLCQRPQFWRTSTGRPCYFVPQGLLWPMAALKLILDVTLGPSGGGGYEQRPYRAAPDRRYPHA